MSRELSSSMRDTRFSASSKLITIPRFLKATLISDDVTRPSLFVSSFEKTKCSCFSCFWRYSMNSWRVRSPDLVASDRWRNICICCLLKKEGNSNSCSAQCMSPTWCARIPCCGDPPPAPRSRSSHPCWCPTSQTSSGASLSPGPRPPWLLLLRLSLRGGHGVATSQQPRPAGSLGTLYYFRLFIEYSETQVLPNRTSELHKFILTTDNSIPRMESEWDICHDATLHRDRHCCSLEAAAPHLRCTGLSTEIPSDGWIPLHTNRIPSACASAECVLSSSIAALSSISCSAVARRQCGVWPSVARLVVCRVMLRYGPCMQTDGIATIMLEKYTFRCTVSPITLIV